MANPSVASDLAQLNNKLDELAALNESEFESLKTTNLFQYFDKIYTLSFGTAQFQVLIDTLVSRQYAKLCYPIFKRIHNDIFKNQDRWNVAFFLIHSLWNYTDKSQPMCTAVVEQQLLPMFIFNLKNENYLKHFATNDAIKKLFDMLVSIIYNIAQIPELVDTLRRQSCLEVFNRLLSTVASQRIFLKGISYLALAFIIREDERSHLTNSNESIPYLVGLLSDAVVAEDRRAHGLEARELCNGLSKLSVANDNKQKIFAEGKLLDSLFHMLDQHTRTAEQISACTLIWNLAFDPNVRKSYAEHSKLNQILVVIAQTASNDELRRAASGCLCTLMGGPKSSTTSRKQSNASTNTETKMIMISYNHDVKQTSKQIKDRLATDGYNVWIDFENMHGNLLDAMSDAIENSSVFVMCLTEKYKDSPSCRLECEYAYQRKKTIIPILLQPNYKPDGWLGIVVGNKLYINYTKKPFDTAYIETLTEIKVALNRPEKKPTTTNSPKKIVSPAEPPRPPVPIPAARATSPTTSETNLTMNTSSSALTHLMSQFRMDKAADPMPISLANWEKLSITDTQRLLAENGLEKFMGMFIDMDGAKLNKLLEIRTKAPQVYYMLLRDQWDQMNQARAQSRDTSSPARTVGPAAPPMSHFLQFSIALDKLADRLCSR